MQGKGKEKGNEKRNGKEKKKERKRKVKGKDMEKERKKKFWFGTPQNTISDGNICYSLISFFISFFFFF